MNTFETRPIEESETPRGRPGLVVLGVVMAVAGVVGAIALWLAAEQHYDDGVDVLARAPVGCETVISMGDTGEVLLFAEVSGRFDETSGDCRAEGVFRADSPTPTVNVDVTAPSGDLVAVEAESGVEYDRGGFRGLQVGRMEITEEGDHVVRVSSGDGTFAVAIGSDPKAGVFALRAGALIALAAGAVAALAFITVGRRSPRAPGLPDNRRSDPPREWRETESVVSAPPQRPVGPPPIPGQPPGPGWGHPIDDPSGPLRHPVEPETSREPPGGSPWAPPSR